MQTFLQTPLFGILLSLLAFELGVTINKKWHYSILNPLLIANIFIIGFLCIFNINLETYNMGGDYISMLLSPATVILAVPLYKQIHSLKKFWFPILMGIFIGSLASICLVIVSCKILGIGRILTLSLIPKSVTIPMGSVVSLEIGGIPSITIIAIVISGITGAVCAPIICKSCKIKHPIAEGVAIGTASHALGTTKAFDLGQIQGAISSLSIGIAGLFTAIVTPIILKIIHF